MTDRRRTPLRRLLLLSALMGGASLVEDTATGNPVVFSTEVAKPLKSLLIPFTPQQEGTGDPSPQNIRSILPWNGLAVQQAGKNLFNKYIKPYRTGMYISEVRNNTVGYTGNENYNVYRIPVKSNTYYTFGLIKASTPMYAMLDEQGYVVYSGANEGGQTGTYKTVLTTGTTKFLLLSVAVNGTYKCDDVLQLEEGETHTEYEPITETDISFPSPVYGGTLDVVSGVLGNGWNDKTVAEIRFDKKADHIFQGYFSDRKYGVGVFSIISDTYKTITAVASTGSTIESLYSQYGDGIYINSGSGTFYICDSNYTDVDAFQTAMANVQVVYELATPQEIQLTPQQLTALVGNNTIWSDANGQMTAVYLKKG